MENIIKVEEISIEHQSVCNRKCPWCSNFVLPSRDYKELSEDTLDNIIQSINSNRNYFEDNLVISACRYNEPFYNAELAVHRMNKIKEKIPKSFVQTNTNGDFLSKKIFEELKIDKVNILDYDYKGLELGQKILKNYGIEITNINEKNGRINGHTKNGTRIVYRTNFLETAKLQDRGGSISSKFSWKKRNGKINTIVRDFPCLMVLKTVSIDYTGDVFLCYNMRHDYPGHDKFIVGNVNKESLIDILKGDKAKVIKKLANSWNDFPDACKNCSNRRKVKGKYLDFYDKNRVNFNIFY